MMSYKTLPNNSVLCLIAPTASGKTDLACQLYQTGRFELISVDSAMIYQDMNIGTAKPSLNELKSFPHHLVNIIKPTDSYSVANFVTDTKQLIESIHNNNKLPLLVGGTMMYYMALLEGLSAVPDTTDDVRQQVNEWLLTKGIDELYNYLKMNDPDICKKIKISDTQRITRAVEVYVQTNIPMSVWQKTPKQALAHNNKQNWQVLSIEPNRTLLHKRIEERLNNMWQQGFIDEVIDLLQKYPNLSPNMPSMRCVGYRQVLEFLAITDHKIMQISPIWQKFADNLQKNNTIFAKNGQIAYNTACQDMKNKALYATRQLAKRQSTWQRQFSRLAIPTITDTSPISSHFAKTTMSKNKLSIVSYHNIEQVQQQLL